MNFISQPCVTVSQACKTSHQQNFNEFTQLFPVYILKVTRFRLGKKSYNGITSFVYRYMYFMSVDTLLKRLDL